MIIVTIQMEFKIQCNVTKDRYKSHIFPPWIQSSRGDWVANWLRTWTSDRNPDTSDTHLSVKDLKHVQITEEVTN